MKGDEKVIDYLNRSLRHELTAVNQYWLHYRLLEDWGFRKLAKKEREESIEEMQHADSLVERIIFLEGHPNLQHVAPLRIEVGCPDGCDAVVLIENLAQNPWSTPVHPTKLG